MKLLDCDVYIDLMPLVRDGAASAASRQALEEHLAGCARCRALYASLPALPEGPSPQAVVKTLARLRRRALLGLAALTVLGALLGLALNGSGGVLYNVVLLPLVGAAAYFVLRRRAWLAPVGLFALTYVWLLVKYLVTGEIPLSAPAALLGAPAMWACWYALFCLGGVGLGWLFGYAFGRLPAPRAGQAAPTSRQAAWRRAGRIAAAAAAIGGTAFLLLTLNLLVGNPFSKMVARAAAEKAIAQQWPELGLEVREVTYSLKTNGYVVAVESDTSIDTRFSLYYDFFGRGGMYGDLAYWQYTNACTRADRQYRELCAGPLAEFENDPAAFAYGTLASEDGELPAWVQPDAVFDMAAIGRTDGALTVYLVDEELDAAAAARWLLRLRRAFDEAGVAFARVDLVLMRPHAVGEEFESVHLLGMPYEDITEDGMEERAREYMEESAAYFAAEDAKTAALEKQAEDEG